MTPSTHGQVFASLLLHNNKLAFCNERFSCLSELTDFLGEGPFPRFSVLMLHVWLGPRCRVVHIDAEQLCEAQLTHRVNEALNYLAGPLVTREHVERALMNFTPTHLTGILPADFAALLHQFISDQDEPPQEFWRFGALDLRLAFRTGEFHYRWAWVARAKRQPENSAIKRHRSNSSQQSKRVRFGCGPTAENYSLVDK